MSTNSIENAGPQTGGSGSDERATVLSPGEGAHAGYLAFAIHEIRNPLSTALWSAELLSRMSTTDRAGARGDKLSRMCLRALSRLRLLIEDHFLIERLDAGGVPLRFELLDVKEVLAAVIEGRPQNSGPCDHTDLPSCAVQADRHLLERSLEALLGVAGQGGTSVRVSGRPGQDRLTLAVQGAPPIAAGLADPDRDSNWGGKAECLSLPMARRAVRVLGGELRVEGGGYELWLPIHQA